MQNHITAPIQATRRFHSFERSRENVRIGYSFRRSEENARISYSFRMGILCRICWKVRIVRSSNPL